MTSQLYHGKNYSQTVQGKRAKIGLLIICSIILILAYWLFSKRDGGKFTNFKQIELVELLSFSNFYNGKKICTRGYYVADDRLSIIKVKLEEDELTRSAWVALGSGRIGPPSIEAGWVEAELCGYFESRRDGQFGDPAVWQHQITVDSYKTFGNPIPVE